jgi:O-antigen ligase
MFLPVILGIAIIYFLLLFHFASSNKKIGNLLGDAFTIFLFCVMQNLTISPFLRFYPGLLTQKLFELISPSGIIVLGFYGLAFVVLNIYFRNYLENTLSIFKDISLGILLLVLLFCPFWSFAFSTTMKATAIIFFVCTLAAHIGKRYSLEKICTMMRYAYLFTGFMSMFYAIFKPAIGIRSKGWRGIYIHENFLGIGIALNMILWILNCLNKPKYPWLSWTVVIISFYILQMTKSAGAFVNAIFLIGLLGLLQVLKNMSARQAFAAIVIFMAVSIVTSILVIENWVELLSSLDKDPSLTGRTQFWPQLIEAMGKRPLLGYGYDNFWQPDRGLDNPAANIETTSGYKPPNAHNGFIQLGIELGYVGLILFGFSFFRNLALGSLFLTKSQSIESRLPLIFLAYLALQNITESNLLGPNFLWFFYVMFTVKLNDETEKIMGKK